MGSAVAPVRVGALSKQEFDGFRRVLFEQVGITMSDTKQALVSSRLGKRLAQLGIERYGEYLALIGRDRQERQIAVDLLTTNETYFFREPEHFDYLGQHIGPRLRDVPTPRVWCAASSTGEEPYTIAMVLAESLGHLRFEVLASDVSTRVLQRARQALYPIEDAQDLPREMRIRWCLKGVGRQQGWFGLDRGLRDRVRFEHINLNAPLPDIGSFDVIFVRNVMIYFSQTTRQQVMGRLIPRLNRGGNLFISHSETLHGVTDLLRAVKPSIYVHRD